MKRLRAWLYFLLFLFIFVGLSILRETSPDVYDRYASVLSAVWYFGVVILSLAALRQWRKPRHPKDAGGFGVAGLPLPRTWKRWIYDERGDDKKNSK